MSTADKDFKDKRTIQDIMSLILNTRVTHTVVRTENGSNLTQHEDVTQTFQTVLKAQIDTHTMYDPKLLQKLRFPLL